MLAIDFFAWCWPSAPRSPTRVLVFDERQLRGVLALYAAHYQGWRPHRALLLCPQQRDLLPFGERQIPTGQRS